MNKELIQSPNSNRKSKIENPKWVGIVSIALKLSMCAAPAADAARET